MCVPWSEFAVAAPDIAEGGQALLTQYGPGLGFVATVRADGGPRVHPCCPTIAEGRLWLFVTDSPKRRDLHRDGRYALHSFPPEQTDDEFFLRGTAHHVVPDGRLHGAIAGSTDASIGTEGEELFELRIGRALWSVYEARGVFPPSHHKWTAPGV